MNVFSISDIEQLCGIKAHTLRIWEQRYQLLMPGRKTNRHRMYTNDDLQYLLRVSFLYYKGYRISKIAAMEEAEIADHILRFEVREGSAEIYINKLTQAAIDFNQGNFERVLDSLVLQYGLEKSVSAVLFPMLNRVGKLWVVNRMMPAQEHFASILIGKKILLATEELDKPISKGKKERILLFTPPNEFHELPLLIMNYLFRKAGIQTIYMGTNAHIDSISAFCSRSDISHAYFHTTCGLSREDLTAYLYQLGELFPSTFIVGSGKFNVEKLPANARWLYTREEMISFVKSLS